MLGKVINSLVNNCKKGWRFDKGSCLFNAKVIISVLVSLNLLALILLFFKREVALDITFFSREYHPLFKLTYPLIFFVVLSIRYPKAKLETHQPTEFEQKSYLRYYLYYVIFSIALLVFSATY
jgi:hypothetical protein